MADRYKINTKVSSPGDKIKVITSKLTTDKYVNGVENSITLHKVGNNLLTVKISDELGSNVQVTVYPKDFIELVESVKIDVKHKYNPVDTEGIWPVYSSTGKIEQSREIKTIAEIRQDVGKEYFADKNVMALGVQADDYWKSMISRTNITIITEKCDEVAKIYAEQFINTKP